MGRTRFMVVKAKELIKTAVFAVLGVIILVGLIAFFLNMGKHDGAYRDGTYYEEMQLGEETAEIAVTIAEGGIAEVSMEEATEAEGEGYFPFGEGEGKGGPFKTPPAAPLRIKIAIPAAWCYTTYKGRGLAACAPCRKI